MMPGGLYKGDCLEIMGRLEADSVDALVTDPPAGISFMGKDWDHGDSFIPKITEIMKECLRVLKPGAHGFVWALPRTSHWTATALENAGFEIRDVVTHVFGSGFPKSLNLGSGWGTALKPASEHWILVRKPVSEKTVAANMLKHGTGGINIDASRIRTSETLSQGASNLGFNGVEAPVKTMQHSQGRFPANLVLDEEAAEMLDEQSGICGGASRFFYCAKTSKSERNAGCENRHPTVKSKKLMSYLINLITPQGGRVLDPFMGSGSTGLACTENDFLFIGIEKEQDYFEIAKKRIQHGQLQMNLMEQGGL